MMSGAAATTPYSMQNAENLISRDMNDTMKRLVKIELLVEDILTLRQEMVEFDRKRNYNRECLGAFRRGEVQTNSKLWMTIGSGNDSQMFVKLPRKNLVSMVEQEQVKLNTLIEENRVKCKAKVRELTQVMGGAEEMSRHMGDIDPYVLSLLIKEQTPQKG